MKISTLTLLMITGVFFQSSANNNAASPFGVNNVVLKSFQASTDGKSARLTWELAEMEQEVTCIVERSDDGVNFRAVESAQIKKGFNGVMSMTDKMLSPGVYYYRLHISKLGFIPFLSNIISIRINKENDAVADYRVINPFSQQITISGKFGSKAMRIEIADMNGRVRLVKNVAASYSGQSITFSTGSLDKGAYILRIKAINAGEESIIVTKHIIKNE